MIRSFDGDVSSGRGSFLGMNLNVDAGPITFGSFSRLIRDGENGTFFFTVLLIHPF